MSADRWVVLGLARVRAPWFTEVARWATSGAVAVDFVKCVSIEELQARLDSGRAVSALLVDGGRLGVDRDLIDRARRAGAIVIVVEDHHGKTDWRALGAAVTLGPAFTRAELLEALRTNARAIGRVDHAAADHRPRPDTPWRARLVAVTGPGGTGTSTVAMAAAQAWGCLPGTRGLVLLADLCLDGDLAVLHDARDLVPGVPELVEAARNGVPTEGIRDLVHRVSDRGYDLLLGLRNHRDWTAIRPRAFEHALDALRRNYRLVVADIDADLEGEDETGSADVADRNHMARSTARAADVVLVVGEPGVKGMHALVRTVTRLHAAGVEPDRIAPVFNRVGRAPRQRAELAQAYRALARDGRDAPLAGPVFLPTRRHLDDVMAQVSPLPEALCRPTGALVRALLDRLPRATAAAYAEPVPVRPGSLGSWSDDADGAA